MKSPDMPPAPAPPSASPTSAATRYRYLTRPPETIALRLSDLADALPASARRPGFNSLRLLSLPCREVFASSVPKISLRRLAELAPDSITAEGAPADKLITLPTAKLAHSFQYVEDRIVVEVSDASVLDPIAILEPLPGEEENLPVKPEIPVAKNKADDKKIPASPTPPAAPASPAAFKPEAPAIPPAKPATPPAPPTTSASSAPAASPATPTPPAATTATPAAALPTKPPFPPADKKVTTEAKPAEIKTDLKPHETKSAETQSADTKPVEIKTADIKPAESSKLTELPKPASKIPSALPDTAASSTYRSSKPPFIPAKKPELSANIPPEEPAADVPEPVTPPASAPAATPPKSRGFFSLIFRRKEEPATPAAKNDDAPTSEKSVPPLPETPQLPPVRPAKEESPLAKFAPAPAPAIISKTNPPIVPVVVNKDLPKPPPIVEHKDTHKEPTSAAPIPPAVNKDLPKPPAPPFPSAANKDLPKPPVETPTAPVSKDLPKPPAEAPPAPTNKDLPKPPTVEAPAAKDLPKLPVAEPPSATTSPKDITTTVLPAAPAPSRLVETEHLPKKSAATPPPAGSPSQEALQSLFLTEEYLSVERVLELCSDLPGITSCVLSHEATVVAAHNVPDSIDLVSLSAHAMEMLRAMRASSAKMGLGSIPAVTIHSEKGPVSFFNKEDLCLLVLHKDRGFVPGVREKLHQVLTEISRGPLELPVGPKRPA